MFRSTAYTLFARAARLALVSLPLAAAGVAGAQNAAPDPKVELGRQVFRDSNLSQPAGQACSDCHHSNRAFTSKGATSAGANPKLFGFRNAPGITYSMFAGPLQRAADDGGKGYQGGQFRDGRAPTLQVQAAMPLINPIEMGNPDLATVVAKVAAASYADTFRQIYGANVFANEHTAVAAIEDAIASFESGPDFQLFNSKYDAYVAGNASLTDAEQRGLAVFSDPTRGNCALCHVTSSKLVQPALFTDFGYDNLGVPRNPQNRYYRMPPSINPDGRDFVDLGLNRVIPKHSTRGQFKAPSLRNVAVTGPYTHNGYFKTLRGVLDFYNTRDVKPRCPDKFTTEADAEAQGCWPEPEVSDNVNKQNMGNLHLSDQEIDDMLAFLNTLTDGWNPGAEAPARADPK